MSARHCFDSARPRAGASLLIFANKQDLPGALSCNELAQLLELNRISESRHWKIQSASAVTGTIFAPAVLGFTCISALLQVPIKTAGEGLIDGVDFIVSDIANRIFMLE